ncbi:uncharacterized protein EV422DRAFT_528445 [Fimicolochytrium jonesii]|uniref:uncharacterized protein n=1 Tax=Fimicolochytrium jonesii TaxID=1396493 RepID=UPI0022FDECDE|nr:uncharacterized protein EV422DRAFT_528445 [Fimicolochytrium jonesii]KAI8820945.1 hypothetical protein EV422DRAFT_528445 [Fimicolochytrium jonesii]
MTLLHRPFPNTHHLLSPRSQRNVHPHRAKSYGTARLLPLRQSVLHLHIAHACAVHALLLAETLKVTGEQHIKAYQANKQKEDGTSELSSHHRHFCTFCGSALWAADARWPTWIWPYASAIDTPLPQALKTTHIFLASKPDWVPVEAQEGDLTFEGYPEDSIESTHKKNGWWVE